MKKLIVMAAVVCAAVAAQAVNLTWSWSGTFTDAKGDALDARQYKAYLYKTSTFQEPTAPETGNPFKIPEGMTYVASSGWDDSNNRFGDMRSQASDFATQQRGWMIVLVDDIVTQDELESGVECYAAVITGNRAFTSTLMSISNTSGGQLAWYGMGEPTPEPTSGLLVLIGMGALALKRKRA